MRWIFPASKVGEIGLQAFHTELPAVACPSPGVLRIYLSASSHIEDISSDHTPVNLSMANRHSPQCSNENLGEEVAETFDEQVARSAAHAMKGDREHCLSAGMDDYISKPYTQEVLAVALNHWLVQSPPDSP